MPGECNLIKSFDLIKEPSKSYKNTERGSDGLDSDELNPLSDRSVHLHSCSKMYCHGRSSGLNKKTVNAEVHKDIVRNVPCYDDRTASWLDCSLLHSERFWVLNPTFCSLPGGIPRTTCSLNYMYIHIHCKSL